MRDRLSQQISIHDQSQFELRLDYNQDCNLKKNCYRIQSYLFFPRSLRIDKHHYAKDVFYRDLKTNIRLKTPPIALNKLVDSDNSSSLKARISQPLNKLLSGTAKSSDIEDIIYELKVFGTVFRGQVVDQTNAILDLVDQVKDGVERYTTICNDIQKTLKLFIKDITQAIDVFRKLRSKFLRPTVPDKLNLVLEEINEFISLAVDRHLSRLIFAVDSVSGLESQMGGSYSKTLALLKREAEYRRGAAYLSGDPLAHEGEKYVYRKSELKKTIMEVLFLRPKVQKEGGKTAQAIAMLAAASAMIWALMALLLGHSAFVVNSMPFLLLMVFSYVVKDRIKDTIKTFLKERVLSKYFYDRKVDYFHNKTRQPVGYVRESSAFLDKSRVPEEILSARYQSGRRFESILYHDRVVTLFSKQFEQLYSAVTNFTRLSVDHFISKMDDADVEIPCFVEQENGIRPVKMSKVYHIHLVVKLSGCCKAKEYTLKHYRIVLNKRGIKRIEVLDGSSNIVAVIKHSVMENGQEGQETVDPCDMAEEQEIPLAHTTKPATITTDEQKDELQ